MLNPVEVVVKNYVDHMYPRDTFITNICWNVKKNQYCKSAFIIFIIKCMISYLLSVTI